MWLSSYSSQFSSPFIYRKVYGYVAIILTVLLMSWEYQKVDAALMSNAIPEEAIRLRILAHSDSPSDQAIKAIVRDRIIEKMNAWSYQADTIEQARLVVKQQLNEFEDVVRTVLEEYGYTYSFQVELKEAEFPTKIYGNLVYSAGMYETLLITIGDGAGRNWWCVLFPPLCFTDAVKGEATSVKTNTTVSDASVKNEIESDVNVVEADTDKQIADGIETEEQLEAEHSSKVKVTFFIADAWAWIKGLFV